MEGRGGSDGCKGKEVIFPFCLNGKFLFPLPDGQEWYLTEMLVQGGTGVLQHGIFVRVVNCSK